MDSRMSMGLAVEPSPVRSRVLETAIVEEVGSHGTDPCRTTHSVAWLVTSAIKS